MNLAQHLAQIEGLARVALAVEDGTATDDERTALLTVDDESPEHAATAVLHSGYPFTPSPDSPVIAVLAVGGPDIRMTRDRDGYALTAYAPGHPHAELRTETVTRWGRMIDEETNR